MRFILLLLAFFVLPFSAAASAGEVVQLDKSSIQLISSATQVAPGDEFYIAAHVKLADHWHTYTYDPGDAGIPFSIDWQLPPGFSLSEIYWPPFKQFDEAGLTTYGYGDEVVFIYKATAGEALSEPLKLAGEANYLVCMDVCIPQTASVELNIDVGQLSPSIYADFIAGWLSEARTAAQWKAVENRQQTSKAPVIETLAANNESIDDGTPLLEADDASLPPVDLHPRPYLIYMLFAFFGGIILNLMPCVFPVLSLKVIAIANHTVGEAREIRLESIAYTLGVLTCFIVLASLLISLQAVGEVAGWGFQFQSPGFVAMMALLLFFIGLNLSGLFELPVLFGNYAAKLGLAKGVRGSYLTGLLAALVATPCTAPFMAPAIGFALSQSAASALLIFTCLGLGLAFPFILLGVSPHLLKWLPRPGAWMETLKHFLAFPMYLSALWLLWVLGVQTGIEGIITTLLFAIFVIFFIWAKGRCHFHSRFCFIASLFILLAMAALLIEALGKFGHTNQTQAVSIHTNEVAYSAPALAELRSQGKAVFLDATASWCITCKVNYRVAISTDSVQQEFARQDITYMVADWTSRDPEITKLLSSYGFKGVPLYIYYAPYEEGVILPQILTPGLILDSISPSYNE